MPDHNAPLTGRPTTDNPTPDKIVATVGEKVDAVKNFFQSKKQMQGATGSGILAGLTFLSVDQLAALGAPWPVIVGLILVSALPSVVAQLSETYIDLRRQIRTPEIPHDKPLGPR